MSLELPSAFAQRGEVWNAYRRHYGPDGDPSILVAQGASRDFNPTLSERIVQRALERDYAAAQAEYLGQFRSDLETFVSYEVVESAVDPGLFERPPLPGMHYFAFIDPSGGSSDSMAMAVAHREGDNAGFGAVEVYGHLASNLVDLMVSTIEINH